MPEISQNLAMIKVKWSTLAQLYHQLVTTSLCNVCGNICQQCYNLDEAPVYIESVSIFNTFN